MNVSRYSGVRDKKLRTRKKIRGQGGERKGGCTNCRGLILVGAVERRGALVVGIRDVILPM